MTGANDTGYRMYVARRRKLGKPTGAKSEIREVVTDCLQTRDTATVVSVMIVSLYLMNDIHIRAALRKNLISQYGTDPDTAIIEELGIHHGASRIDLVVVNGVLHGYELKSDRDTLTRLSEQALAYATVFDLVTLVVGERHVRDAVEIVPDWWGVRVARMESRRLSFCDLKLSMKNPSADPMSVASLLWRGEALSFLEELGGEKGMHYKSRAELYLKLVELVDFDHLRARVRMCLKGRQDWRSAETRQSCGD